VLDWARALRRKVAFILQLRVLPPRVAWFQWRAGRLATRLGDGFSSVSATRPRKLAVLLSLARGRQRVVELGTATAWTAISLVLADRTRVVATYDPIERAERELYLRLVKPGVRDRVTFVRAPGDEGPQSTSSVDLLYIDSSHNQEDTVREMEAWRPVLGDGALVVFDDFTHPEYPGIRDAVMQLRLEGEEREGLFVHRVSLNRS
jgi:predicted O-methyltransferase YrrM